MQKLTGLEVIDAIETQTKDLNASGVLRAHVVDGGFERWWQGSLLPKFFSGGCRLPRVWRPGDGLCVA